MAYFGGIDPRSKIGRGLEGLEEDLGTIGEIGGTFARGVGNLAEEYNPLELVRKGIGAIGDAAYGLIAPPPEPQAPRSTLPGGVPVRPLPTGPAEPYPDLHNPLGMPPMRLEGIGTPVPPKALAAASGPSGGYRAVRMPDGKITFTNLGAGAGGEVLSEDATDQAAQSAGFMRSPNPPPIEAAQLPDTIGGAGDPSYRRLFDRDNNLENVQNRELVERADAANRAGRQGNVSMMELKPGDDGLTTPGFEHYQDQQAQDKLGGLGRRAAVADASIKVREAEEWARMPPQQRRDIIAAQKAAEKPNLNLQIIEHLQGQLADVQRRAAQVDAQVEAQYPNTAHPDTVRKRAEYKASLQAALQAEADQIIQVGGLPFKADPYGLLNSGNQPGAMLPNP